eukprot:67969-Hanusia_phi.AAC.1
MGNHLAPTLEVVVEVLIGEESICDSKERREGREKSREKGEGETGYKEGRVRECETNAERRNEDGRESGRERRGRERGRGVG